MTAQCVASHTQSVVHVFAKSVAAREVRELDADTLAVRKKDGRECVMILFAQDMFLLYFAFSPACRRMLFSVSKGRSFVGCGTVTVRSGLGRMLEVVVAAIGFHKKPPVRFDLPDDLLRAFDIPHPTCWAQLYRAHDMRVNVAVDRKSVVWERV